MIAAQATFEMEPRARIGHVIENIRSFYYSGNGRVPDRDFAPGMPRRMQAADTLLQQYTEIYTGNVFEGLMRFSTPVNLGIIDKNTLEDDIDGNRTYFLSEMYKNKAKYPQVAKLTSTKKGLENFRMCLVTALLSDFAAAASRAFELSHGRLELRDITGLTYEEKANYFFAMYNDLKQDPPVPNEETVSKEREKV